MGDIAHSRDRSIPSALFTLIGPRTATLVGACVAVLTAHTLGVEWLTHHFVGMPMGVWIVALVMLVAQYRHQRGAAAGLPAEEGARRLELNKLNLATINLSAMRSALPSANTVGGMLELVGVPADSLGHAKRTLNNFGAKVAPQASTLRIGVDLADADARELIAYGLREENLGVQVEWCKGRSGLVADVERDMAAQGLDVLIRRERRGDINVFVAEQPDHPAAWQEWGTSMPIGYAGLFPPRIDPARVVLSGCDLQQASHAELAARMTIACAMLARVPGRAGVGRSSLGRMLGARPGMATLVSEDGPLSCIMRRVAHGLENFAGLMPASVPGFVKSAARASAAFLTTTESHSALETTRESVALSARLCAEEPESLLRLAAAEFAAGHGDDARRTLVRGATVLRAADRRCDADPLPFIMSEVEVGTPGRMALGRIAAGIGLLWATAPHESVDYLREDLLDDLSHAGWLRDRPSDVDLLKSVIATLEQGSSVRLQAA
jgi:hypothetical protein